MSDDLRRALAELVALKDLKDSITEPDNVILSKHVEAFKDYKRRKPAAWAAARAALAQPPEPVALTADDLWNNHEIMSINGAEAGLTMETLLKLTRAIERAVRGQQ